MRIIIIICSLDPCMRRLRRLEWRKHRKLFGRIYKNFSNKEESGCNFLHTYPHTLCWYCMRSRGIGHTACHQFLVYRCTGRWSRYKRYCYRTACWEAHIHSLKHKTKKMEHELGDELLYTSTQIKQIECDDTLIIVGDGIFTISDLQKGPRVAAGFAP